LVELGDFGFVHFGGSAGALAARALAELAPGDDRHVGAVEALGRDVHGLDHDGILVVEQAMEDPTNVGPVAGLEPQGFEAGGELGRDLNVAVVLGVAGHVPLVVGPARVGDAQAARKTDGAHGSAAAASPPVASRPFAEAGIVDLLHAHSGGPARDPIALGRLDVRAAVGRHTAHERPQRASMEELGVALIEAILSRQPPVAGANCDSAGARVRLLQELTGDVILDRPSPRNSQIRPMRSSTG